MTFMRKILDALNMDNWNTKRNTSNSLILDVLTYWTLHPQPYTFSDQYDIPLHEYTDFSKTMFLYWFGDYSSPDNVHNIAPTCAERCKISNPAVYYMKLISEG